MTIPGRVTIYRYRLSPFKLATRSWFDGSLRRAVFGRIRVFAAPLPVFLGF
jgi:hypothetical protein